MTVGEQIADELYGLHCDIGRLETENAKLRRLCADMHSELVSCEDNGYVCGGHKFDDRVHELGIEVMK